MERIVNNNRLSEFKSRLTIMRQELVDENEEIVKYMEEYNSDSNEADFMDRVSIGASSEPSVYKIQQNKKIIELIDKALEKVKNNTYGYCESCGEEIGLERLEANPYASKCISCKAISESNSKKYSVEEKQSIVDMKEDEEDKDN